MPSKPVGLKKSTPYYELLMSNAFKIYPEKAVLLAALTAATVEQESTWVNNLVSRSGCKGLGQLCDQGVMKKYNVTDPMNVKQNLWGSMNYIADNLRQWGDRRLLYVASSYHAGGGAASRAFHRGVLPDTSDGLIKTSSYSVQVLSKMKNYLE